MRNVRFSASLEIQQGNSRRDVVIPPRRIVACIIAVIIGIAGGILNLTS
jgi:hypothetical protein